MTTPEQRILAEIERARMRLKRPIVVAIDGGSGAGKSTLAERLTRMTQVALVQLDDFYQTRIPECEWPRKTVEQRLSGVFEWHRVRAEALEPLRAGLAGCWHAFDFLGGLNEAGTYAPKAEITKVEAAPTILLEGAYSASPQLRDLIDLAVLVNISKEERDQRAAARERDNPDLLIQWHAIWDEVEAHYFEHVCPPGSFDLAISNRSKAESRPVTKY